MSQIDYFFTIITDFLLENITLFSINFGLYLELLQECNSFLYRY